MLASVKLRLGKGTEAWSAAESDRGRALLDVLAERGVRDLSPDELAEEQRLNDELARLAGILEVLDADSTAQALAGADSVRTLLLKTQSQWATYQMALRDKYPVSEGGAYPLERVQMHLDAGSGIIGWLDTDEESYAYLVPHKGEVRWVKLAVADLPMPSGDFVAVGPASDQTADSRVELARRIYDERMAPLSLDRLDHLYVVPSGQMLGVPVEALMTGERTYVIDRWQISYAPSATVLTWIKEKSAPRSRPSLFAIGDPPFNMNQAQAMDDGAAITEVSMVGRGVELDPIYRAAGAGNREAIGKLKRLAGTRQEIESIGRFFESREVLLGREASEQRILDCVARDGLDQHGYFHIATHALPNTTRGRESALVLSQVDLPDALTTALAGERIIDGRLTMEEVVREWQIDADLVTLSACETALGQRERGEGYIGFAHAFFLVGARTVVVSFWKVADRPTRLLMERFYTNMLANGMAKSEALRDAKLWLRDLTNQRGETPYADPFYWSSFVLIGDPG
jgi:CHAT domain-containing protein